MQHDQPFQLFAALRNVVDGLVRDLHERISMRMRTPWSASKRGHTTHPRVPAITSLQPAISRPRPPTSLYTNRGGLRPSAHQLAACDIELLDRPSQMPSDEEDYGV